MVKELEKVRPKLKTILKDTPFVDRVAGLMTTRWKPWPRAWSTAFYFVSPVLDGAHEAEITIRAARMPATIASLLSSSNKRKTLS